MNTTPDLPQASRWPSPVTWLNQPAGATHLEIVCLGWSAPPAAVRTFNPEHAVVAIANPTHTEWVEALTNTANYYDNCRITAWSLGIVTASRLLQDISNAFWVAVNGVGDPFNGCLDRATSEAMATNLTEAMLATFQMGMCGSKAALAQWQALPDHPSLAHAQAALGWWIALADQPAQVPINRWSQVIIGSHDRIMPAAAQQAFWASHPSLTPDIRTAAHWIPSTLVSPWPTP